ncbi:MAG: flagellin [Phycisphaerae bacterium]|jgi:flagellin
MLAIKNNIMAGNAARHLGKAYDGLAKSVERLASGLRINSAKDDAAGLAVRELIRADIAVLQQGARNAQDGISMLQTMEGAMAIIDENLIRMKELAEQAATGSYSTAQRTIMQNEFAEMGEEIDRIAGATKFNDISMLDAAGTVAIHVGTTDTISVNKYDMTQEGLSMETAGTDATYTTVLFNGDTVAATNSGAYIDNSGSTDAASLVVTFNGQAAVTGVAAASTSYTLDAFITILNTASQAAAEHYNIASANENDDGSYSLLVTSAATGVPGGAPVITDAAGLTSGTRTATLGAAAVAATDLDISTVTGATAALTALTSAISTKDSARAAFGYKMNRLEKVTTILDIQAENLMAAESRISDVDVATEMAKLTRTQVLSQAGIAMLAQANAMPQMALSLLR